MLSPLGPRAVEDVTVALGFLALSACGWVIYRLGAEWFGRAAGALAALIFLTRVPVLSYGVRAYVDLPYLLLVLSALLVESRHRGARRPGGAPVLALLALAGLLRPEAWAFSGLYWLYLMDLMPRGRAAQRRERSARARAVATRRGGAPRGEIARLTLLAASAPLVWVLSDLAITGDPLWSLTNTRHTAETLDRVTGIANVPEYIPRRIGEILRPPVLVGRRARRRAVAAVAAPPRAARRARRRARRGRVRRVRLRRPAHQHPLRVPRRRRSCASSAAPAPSAGCACRAAIRAGAGGWPAARSCCVALLAYAPVAVPLGPPELGKLARQHSIEDDLLALVDDHAINLRCGPVGVPNHAPVPLLALYLKTSPAQHRQPRSRPHRLRRLRRPGQQGSRRRLRARPPRPGRARERPAGLHRVRRQPLVADLPALHVASSARIADRAPLVEIPGTRRRSPPTTPVRELPLRLPVIA